MSTREPAARGADVSSADALLTIVLVAVQAAGSLGVGTLLQLIAGALGTGNAVGTGLGWLLLVGGVVVSIVLAGLAASDGRPTWPWPFVGASVSLIGVVTLLIGTAS